MKAVFLDRDGTVILDPPDFRVDSIDEIELFPDSIEALKLLADNGFAVVFITNQAGIGEGRFTEEEYWTIQEEVVRRLEPSGAKILKTCLCPHAEKAGCDCRKPKPKMILDAAKEFDIDPGVSYMVGDRLSDIEAGIKAGTKTILVKTGLVPVEAPEATYTATTLLEAARYIVEN